MLTMITKKWRCFGFGLLTLTLNLAGTNLTHAQYNHAYPAAYTSGFGTYPMSANALDIVHADPGYQCVLGTIDNTSTLLMIVCCG